MTRHFVTSAGVYIGGFCDASEPPEGGVEVLDPPTDAREVWIDGRWELPLATAQAEAKVAMVQWIEDFLRPFVAEYPAQEIASWPVLTAVAQMHIAGNPQLMILTEASITGDDPDELAKSIVEKSGRFTAIVDHVRGLRRITLRAIEAAETSAEVSAALEVAKGQANEMMDAILNQRPMAEK